MLLCYVFFNCHICFNNASGIFGALWFFFFGDWDMGGVQLIGDHEKSAINLPSVFSKMSLPFNSLNHPSGFTIVPWQNIPPTISHSLFVSLFHSLSLSLFFYRQVMALHWDWRRQKATSTVIFVHSTVLLEKPEMLKLGHDHELQPRRRWASMSWPSFDLGTKFQSEWCKTFEEKPAIHRCMGICGLHICCVRLIVYNFTVCSLHLTTLKFVFFFFVLARLMARGLEGNSVAGPVSQGPF